MCGRGLKPAFEGIAVAIGRVARRVRAWIETVADFKADTARGSPAVCGRGLKQGKRAAGGKGADVARRVRAWIETYCCPTFSTGGNRRPPCAGVD